MKGAIELHNLSRILEGRSNLYVLDLSWHLYRSYFAFKNLYVDVEGFHRPTGNIYGVEKAIDSILSSDPEACIILAQDGYPKRRIELLGESYKAGRAEREWDFNVDNNLIQAITCSIPNVFWAYGVEQESDDLMYALSREAMRVPTFVGKVYLYTGDNDLLQAINDRVFVVRKFDNGHFDVIDRSRVIHDDVFVKKFHGVDPEHIVEFRAIVGDSSDNIRGIPRFPRDVAYTIAMGLLIITEKQEKWYEVYNQNKDLIDRNRQVMKLSEDIDYNVTCRKVNREGLDRRMAELSIKPFLFEKYGRR